MRCLVSYSLCSFVGTHSNHFYIYTTRKNGPHLDPHCDGSFDVLGLHRIFRLPSPGVIVARKMRVVGRITTSNMLIGPIVMSNGGLVDQKTMSNRLVGQNTT